jgi:hypothetical protein
VIGGNKHSQRSINASDIIAGHVEIGEETYADPYFDKTTSVPALGKIKVSALDKVLAQIANLSHEDRGALIVALTT